MSAGRPLAASARKPVMRLHTVADGSVRGEQLPDLVMDGFYFTYERIEGLRTGKYGYEEIRHRRDSEHGGPPTDSL